MKKFLSVLLTIAMVMSLFTGTVLAAPVLPADFTVTAGTASYSLKLADFAKTNDKLDYVINANSDGLEFRQQTGITVTATDVLTVDTSSLTVPTTAESKTYTLTITNKTDVTVDTVTITVIHTLTVNGAAAAPKAVIGNNTFAGKLTYKGAAVKSMIVSIQDAANVVLASVRTDDNGDFSLNVNFTTPAAYGIYVGAVKYYAISFDAVEDLKITVTGNPGSLRSATVPTHTVTFTVAALDSSSPAFAGTEPILVNVTLPNGTVVATTTSASPTFTIDLDNGTLPTNDLVAGTYTVKAVTYIKAITGGETLIADATAYLPARTATTTFTVVDNTSALFINTATINGVTKNVPVNAPTTTNPVVLQLTAPTARTFKSVTYTVTGPLAKTLTVTDTGLAGGAYLSNTKTVAVIGGGVITLSGTATYDNDTTETFSKTFTVAGYVVDFTPATLGAVGTEAELKAVVTNAAGVPINNATVVWTSTTYANAANTTTAFKVWDSTLATPAYVATVVGTNNVINGTASVIQNGTYSLKVKLMEPCIITATVLSNEAAYAGNTFAWNQETVYGVETYTVAAPAADLVTTKTQEISLKVVDANGNAITPDWIYVDDANAISGYANVVTFGTTTKVTFNPGATTGSFNLLLGTDSGKKIVTVPVNVIAPVVTVKVNGTVSTKVTAGILNTVELTFANTAASNVSADVTKVDGTIYTDSAATVALGAGVKATTAGVVSLYTKVVPFKTAAAGASKIDLYVNFGIAAVKVATLTVEQPILTTGITSLDVGTVVDLNLLLTDANGVAMNKYVVTTTGTDAFAGNATATTGTDGKAVLTVSPNAPGTLTLTVAALKTLDSDDVANDAALAASTAFTKAIPVVRDTKGPVFTMDAVYTVTTPTATVSFTAKDGSKVTEVWVGYEKALVRPDGSVVFTATNLSVGENTFDVLAYDYYGNASEAVLTIEYLKPANVVLTIGSLDATKDGAVMTGMDQAPVVVNGRTFLPVRFVFENLLGGTVGWNQATQTISAVVKGNTIQMVVGSKTAVVNGVNVTLLEAPFVAATTNRTLVPMREIMEAIGVTLDWNAVTQTVTLVIPQ